MKNKVIIVLAVAALMTAGLTGGLKAASHVDNISLKKQGEFVELTVYCDGPFTFTHFIEEAKAGKPYRVVIDLKECLHKLPQFNFRDLPTEVITSIRTSQYKIKPEKMVRIVADVARQVTYMVRQEKQSVTLIIAAPSQKEFEFWCVAPLSEAEKIELALSDPDQDAVIQKGAMPAHPESREEAEQKGEFKPPKIAKEPVVKPAEKASRAQPEKDKAGTLEDMGYAQESGPAPLIEKKDKSDGTDQPVPVPKVLAGKDESSAKKEKTASPQPKAVEGKDVKVKELADSQPVAPVPDRGIPDQGTESVSPRVPSKPDEDQQDAKPQEWKSEKKLRQNPDRPPKVKGSLAASFPKRDVIRYRSYGRRDPFMPLLSKSLSGFQSGQLPDVETLRLVGILQGDFRDLALLEDMEGYGYIMESGDKVRNGYVIQIYEDKILFQVEEFGWSRSVALSMDLEE